MSKIKPPSVAGTFYAADKEILKEQIEEFNKNSQNFYAYKSRTVIVPHAGLVYSGQLAYDGLKSLDSALKTLVIFAPAHKVGFKGLALSSFDEWETPLGKIEIDKGINEELNKTFSVNFYDEAFEPEHAVEIQVPLIQSLFKNVKIVPILVGDADFEEIEKIIKNLWKKEDVGFVISSDLSHFYKFDDAIKIDSVTAEMIEANDYQNFRQGQACGIYGVLGLLKFAEGKKYSLIRVGLINSAFITNDKNSVVGYGSWFLYNGSKNEFLKKYYSNEIIEICKSSIFSTLEKTNYFPQNLTAVFYEKGACFVTLEENGQLRGCIGSIVAQKLLIQDLLQNSKHAAFSDPRFNPVQKYEFHDLNISVSLLSIPQKMDFTDEEDFLAQIVPNKDGIIIRDGQYQAVYLPSVWEQISDKKQFINSLKVKAGLPPNYFSKTFEAFRFYSEYIEEEN